MATVEQALARLQRSAFRAKFHLSEQVFIAQHACACCCRGCLHKWYHVPVGRELTENEQKRIVKLLMAWIERQLDCDTR